MFLVYKSNSPVRVLYRANTLLVLEEKGDRYFNGTWRKANNGQIGLSLISHHSLLPSMTWPLTLIQIIARCLLVAPKVHIGVLRPFLCALTLCFDSMDHVATRPGWSVLPQVKQDVTQHRDDRPFWFIRAWPAPRIHVYTKANIKQSLPTPDFYASLSSVRVCVDRK